MREPAEVCPRCGANQEETRIRLMEPLPPPPPWWNLPARRRMPPPRADNAVEPAPCPNCCCWVPAGATSCSYCGHVMVNDMPVWRTDAEDARPYLVASIVCTVAMIAALAGGQFVFAALFVLPAVAFAGLAHGENPMGWGGVAAIGCAIGAILGGLMFIAGLIWKSKLG